MEGLGQSCSRAVRWIRIHSRGRMHGVTCACLIALAPSLEAADERVRVGVLQFGTVNWELDVIRTHELAAHEGVSLKVVPLASKRAVSVALQGRAVDVIVSDWIWVSRQRAAGRLYTSVPYSLAIGAVYARPDSDIETFAQLRGKALGIAGGPLDKSWLLLRAYAHRELGRDLIDEVEPTFAAPPLLNQLLLRGDLPAALNFWHYAARLEAAGMSKVIAVTDVLPALGVQRPVPLLVWVFSDEFAASRRDRLIGFLRASYEAKRVLLESDAKWERLASIIKPGSEAALIALRDGYRAGIPRKFGAAEREAARRVFAILASEGGEALVGQSKTLSAGTFWDGFPIPTWPR